ncbi:MAG TPA: hypothetical protein VGR64_00895 [Terracidiphilus sp.]|nr:hypothetical protein [Terracidiphilus sp.]
MKHLPTCIVLAALSLAAFAAVAQAPASSQPATASSVAANAPPSTLIRPSLDSLQSTLAALRVDRWKRGTVRDEAAGDVQAIQHELRANLPPLLRDADASPQSLSKVLPVVKHVGAVYDVLLRVYDASRVSAPSGQIDQLQSALRNLERARLGLDDHLQTIAMAQEQQMSALRITVQKQAAFKCPAPPPAKPCIKPRVRHYVRHHVVAKPAQKKPAPKPETNAPKKNP